MKIKACIVNGKKWIPSLQGWSWVITISWMLVANFWKPFGLFGFVCMLSPIIIALSGRGKMHCARVCPRGSFLAVVTQKLSLNFPRPRFFSKKWFKPALWSVLMGSFIVMLILITPKGIDALGNAVLIFMEIATAMALATGILFRPRTWCTVCPMGYSTENIRRFFKKGKSLSKQKALT